MGLKSSLQKKVPSVFGAYHFLWAWAGARLHKHPSRHMYVIGVTGTKGKTTTVELLNAILEAAGKQTALLSSLRIKIGASSTKNPTGNSMPGRGFIQKFIRDAKHAGCTYAIVEVTSQGAVQHRHRFIHWNMGVITNLHPEHIESHGSYENYRAAKLDFLKYVLKQDGKVFLNREDKEYPFFAEGLAHGDEHMIEYTRHDERLGTNLSRAERMRDRRYANEEEARQHRFFLSDFNEDNVAVAVTIAKDLGIQEAVIEQALANFDGVPGRMEFMTEGSYTAIVDYAHTPDSLEAAYRAARGQLETTESLAAHLGSFSENPSNRLICVLGAAGGGRDRWKRPEFGKVAAHYCDEIVLTDEDPYDEDPRAIIAEIEAGIAQVPHPRPPVTTILDRREALAHAINAMAEGDIVIATGKGSEDWIHRARGRKEAWNEKALVESLLANKKMQDRKRPALAHQSY